METETALHRTADVIPLLVRRRMRTVRIALLPLPRIGTPEYYALGAITLFLAGFGLLMVLSASSVEQGQSAGNPYIDFGKQAIAEALGVALMLLVSRSRPALLLRAAPIVFAGAVVLQVLTVLTPLGITVNGNRNWIRVAGFTLQPSEFVKLGLVLLVAAVLSRRRAERLGFVGLLPVLLPAALAVLVVLLGKDLGTSMIIGLIVLAGLYFSGVRFATLASLTALTAIVFGIAAATRGSRVDRLAAWSHGCANADVLGTCWQTQQAIWALANGGLFGVGVGNSVSKWFWLPEADNDFILAVIGEETGLVGLTVLLLLFVALAVVALRVLGRSRDRFTCAVVGMAIAWLVGQAFANIAVVLGLAPVFGVPLPFVSAGGSSMIANMLAVGVVMALANAPRDEPGLPAPPVLRQPVRGGGPT